MDTDSEKTSLSKQFCFPSEKGSTLKDNNLIAVRAKSFLLKLTILEEI